MKQPKPPRVVGSPVPANVADVAAGLVVPWKGEGHRCRAIVDDRFVLTAYTDGSGITEHLGGGCRIGEVDPRADGRPMFDDEVEAERVLGLAYAKRGTVLALAAHLVGQAKPPEPIKYTLRPDLAEHLAAVDPPAFNVGDVARLVGDKGDALPIVAVDRRRCVAAFAEGGIWYAFANLVIVAPWTPAIGDVVQVKRERSRHLGDRGVVEAIDVSTRTARVVGLPLRPSGVRVCNEDLRLVEAAKPAPMSWTPAVGDRVRCVVEKSTLFLRVGIVVS